MHRSTGYTFTSYARTTPLKVLVLLLLAGALLSGCAVSEGNFSQGDNSLSTYKVYSGTVLDLGDLRIGVSNFYEGAYVDSSGNSTTGMTAGLWIAVVGNTELSERVRVHEDQTIDLGIHTIQVLEIDQDMRGKYVKLQIDR